MIMNLPLESSQIQELPNVEDLRLAASKMQNVKRRLFQAEMALKYCGGSAARLKPCLGGGVLMLSLVSMKNVQV